MIASPDDQDARYGSKNGSPWTGYKIHLTETYERNAPRLVTHIETTVATSRDATVTEKIQDDLIARGLEPEVHLADGGYMDADNLVSSQEKEIDLVGPVRPDSRWQSKVEGGYDVSRFKIDWEKKVAICPEDSPVATGNGARARTDNLTSISCSNRAFVINVMPALCALKPIRWVGY